MKYKSMVTTAFLMIPFFLTSSTSAEIFEQVHDYDFDAQDIESADFNNDELEDFVIIDYWSSDSSYYEVFLSNGDCSFTRMGSVNIDTSDFGQILTGDYNEDSFDDMLLMNLEETWFYSSDGSGSFSLDEVFPWSLCDGCVGDINNDGHLDVAGVTRDSWSFPTIGNSVIVMLGDGTGNFAEGWVFDEYPPGDSWGFSSSQLACFDNPDTTLDLCMTCFGDPGGLLVFQGTGDGCFSDSVYFELEISGLLNGPYFCACGDFNEDGFADIAVAGDAGMSSPSTYTFINQQNGMFEISGEGYFSGACDIEIIATADLDLDGHLDLSVEGSIAGYGDGIFNEGGSGWLSAVPGADFLDMDIDGDLDLVMRWGGIYRNTTINLGIEGESERFITNILLNVSPNPFSGFVNIEASGYSEDSENIQIFDLSGRLVAELEAISTEGKTVFNWNGVSSSGDELPSGIYTARLYSGRTVITATLLKLE